MDIFNALNLLGGLCLFLFGMNLMGQALERQAGNDLKKMLGRLTGNRWSGLLTGLGVTAVIQSSSATTVMVVGFVNSGLMSLKQSIHVIMGANIGTTVTAWILSLAGIDSGNVFVKLLKPSSFTPILALIGIVFYLFCKEEKKKDIGMILLGFATLMFGMETMSSSVSGLRDIPEFRQLFLLFTNPILGVFAGAVLTAVIQSSSASVGILQALASTGQVTYGAAIPIIMGQNIGTCVTALLSSIGANRNAKRAAIVHLSFNVIGTAVWLAGFCIIRAVFLPAVLTEAASLLGIAVAHSAFNILCTILMLPFGNLLEKLVRKMIPDPVQPEAESELDERLLLTPAIALEQCRNLMNEMAACASEALTESFSALDGDSDKFADSIRWREERTDHYEDVIGTYLVKLSAKKNSDAESAVAAKYLRLLGDFERIADHSVNILESAEELEKKEISFSMEAKEEMRILKSAVTEVMALSYDAFQDDDVHKAVKVEPLEQVIDSIKEEVRTRHIQRLQQGKCTIEAGFIVSDLLTNLERISDHCSNIAGCILDSAQHTMSTHDVLSHSRATEDFEQSFAQYRKKYLLPAEEDTAEMDS